MYRDPVQWKRVRDTVLIQGQSQRKVSRDMGLSRATVAKMVANDIPPPRKQRIHYRAALGPHISTIDRLVSEAVHTFPESKPSAKAICERLKAVANYSGSYSAIRDYVSSSRIEEPRSRSRVRMWEHARDALIATNREESISFLQAMSHGTAPSLSKTRLKGFMRATELYARESRPSRIGPSLEDRTSEWLHSIAMGTTSREQIGQVVGDCDDLPALLEMAQSGKRIIRNRALSVLASKRGASARATSRMLGVSRHSCVKYVKVYKETGADGLRRRKPRSDRKVDSRSLQQAIFALLHEPPSTHGINRTTWKMEDFKEVLASNGHRACPEVIRRITKNAGYRWRRARVVLTSLDPDYRAKLENIQSILSGLGSMSCSFRLMSSGRLL